MHSKEEEEKINNNLKKKYGKNIQNGVTKLSLFSHFLKFGHFFKVKVKEKFHSRQCKSCGCANHFHVSALSRAKTVEYKEDGGTRKKKQNNNNNKALNRIYYMRSHIHILK
jgi:hypothetical protein